MNPRHNIAARAARWSAGHRKIAIFGWLAFVVLSVFVGGAVGQRELTDAEAVAGESGRAEAKLEAAKLNPNEEVVLFKSEKLDTGEPEFEAALAEATRRLRAAPSVKGVSSPTEGGGQISADGHAALVEFRIPGDQEEAEERVDASLAATAAVQRNNPELQVEQFGGASAAKAVNAVFEDDLSKAETTSLPITLLILLVFYMRREREERRAGRSASASLAAAAATSGRAVLVSGLTVIAAMAGMLLSGDPTFTSFAVATMTVVAVAMFASVSVLPAVLSKLGDRVEKGRVPFLRRLRERRGGRSVWAGVVTRVMRRPAVSAVVATGLLLALALPALGMHTVVSGPDDMSRDIPVVRTYDHLRAAFPGEAGGVRAVVEADDVSSGPVAAAIARLGRKAEADPQVVGKVTVQRSADDTVAAVEIPTTGSGSDAAATRAMEAVREQLVPAAFAAVTGASVDVTGEAAQSKDFNDLLGARLPLVIAFVLGLAFLLLLVTFRSIVVPIKAIVLNLLSVGAAYGVLVLVFQDGWGEGLLGFHSNGGVSSWLPLFLFVILFGLSMDYHVLILSRVRENVDRGMGSDEAVERGVISTAGTVTSAAVVMVAVFSVFATLSLIDMKEMGVGLAVAILIDATIVRAVLLPAAMKLLGERNWYLPRSLGWLPRLREPEAAPVPSEA
jgi:uncharacterized membrane protein YdfJ with MMPL/SSD domain